MPAKQRKPSPFLDLPPELRNSIYEYVFWGSTTEIRKKKKQLAISWIYKHLSGTGAVTLGLPAILQVNQQIRWEATGVFSERTSGTNAAQVTVEQRLGDMALILRGNKRIVMDVVEGRAVIPFVQDPKGHRLAVKRAAQDEEEARRGEYGP